MRSSAVFPLLTRFTSGSFKCAGMSCGTLADSKAEIQNDPYYHKMLLALKGTNYDVWILYAMEHIELPGNRLSVIV